TTTKGGGFGIGCLPALPRYYPEIVSFASRSSTLAGMSESIEEKFQLFLKWGYNGCRFGGQKGHSGIMAWDLLCLPARHPAQVRNRFRLRRFWHALPSSYRFCVSSAVVGCCSVVECRSVSQV